MKRLIRPYLWLCAAAVAAFAPCGAHAQEPPPPGGGDFGQRIEEQATQIRLLTREVARLADAVDALQRRVASAPAPVVAVPSTAAPVSAPPAAQAAPAPAAVPVPSAEVTPGPGPLHTVVKGETLTSIARAHGIPLEELIHLNEITDGRKLQIGQPLRLPTPPPPEQP